MRIAQLFTLPLILFVACSSVHTKKELDVGKMMASTVKIKVDIAMTLLFGEVEIPLENGGWSGSGVVYERSGGFVNQPSSKILSANHVLEAPAAGDLIPGPLGTVIRVDAVLMTVLTADGRTCELKALTLGVDDHRDVATGKAMCDAGPAAPLAKGVPELGEKIYVTGHPLGFDPVIVTTGFYSGWWNEYMIGSAAIAPGSSGGPVWNDRGEVIGLAVRGFAKYPDTTIIAPLGEILKRIADTD